MAARTNRAKVIQLIHIGATRLGLIDPQCPKGTPEHDEAYRVLVSEATGGQARSCRDCTDAQLDAVMRELVRRGFTPKVSERRHGRRPQNLQPGDMRSKIEAQLASMGLPWSYAEAILRQMRGLPEGVSCPISATTAIELRALIAALYNEQRKRESLRELTRKARMAELTLEDLAEQLGFTKGWERGMLALNAAHALVDEALMAIEHGECHA